MPKTATRVQYCAATIEFYIIAFCYAFNATAFVSQSAVGITVPPERSKLEK